VCLGAVPHICTGTVLLQVLRQEQHAEGKRGYRNMASGPAGRTCLRARSVEGYSRAPGHPSAQLRALIDLRGAGGAALQSRRGYVGALTRTTRTLDLHCPHRCSQYLSALDTQAGCSARRRRRGQRTALRPRRRSPPACSAREGPSARAVEGACRACMQRASACVGGRDATAADAQRGALRKGPFVVPQ
jgi:hypothetical protein